jgi:hypothetical protein
MDAAGVCHTVNDVRKRAVPVFATAPRFVESKGK